MNVFIKRAGFLALSAPHHEIAPEKRIYGNWLNKRTLTARTELPYWRRFRPIRLVQKCALGACPIIE